MAILNYLITSALLLMGFGNIKADKAAEKQLYVAKNGIPAAKLLAQKHPFFSKVYFSKSDAEKILGEKVHLSDSSSTVKKDTLEIRKAFSSNPKELKTGKTGNVYFMIEEYSQLASAKKAYKAIKTSNEKHEGVKTLQGMGDEAYFHSDGKNFCFILVRKQTKIFRIKVNKITSTTSVDEFKLIAKKIADNL